MRKSSAIFFLLFTTLSTLAQGNNRKAINGKIASDLPETDGIYVVNLATESVAITEKSGYFSILAKEGDTLMFSSVQYKAKRVTLAKADFEQEVLFVKLETLVNILDEVKIMNYNKINAVSLGIIPKGQKKYTPAERHLKTASAFDGQYGTDTKIGLDPILNWMSGRTAMLKKEVQVEKKEFLLAKVDAMFEQNFFTEKLKIPLLYVQGFCYYIVEDSKFAAAVNAKNKMLATFIAGELASEYLKTIEGQK